MAVLRLQSISCLGQAETFTDELYDRDDFIGKHTITTAPAERTLEFVASGGNADGAHYAVVVSIVPGP